MRRQVAETRPRQRVQPLHVPRVALQRPSPPFRRVISPSRKPVIDHQHPPPLDLPRHSRRPLQCLQIHLRRISLNPRHIRQCLAQRRIPHRLLAPPEFRRHIQLPPFPIAEPRQMHRQRIHQFIREMHPRKPRQIPHRIPPAHLPPILTQPRPLRPPQYLDPLYDLIPQRLEKIRRLLPAPPQHILRKRPIIRPLLHNRKLRRFPEPFPHRKKLSRQQLPKHPPHAHIRKIIPSPSQPRPSRSIVPMGRMIQRQLHKIPEPHRAPFGDQSLDRVSLLGGHSPSLPPPPQKVTLSPATGC